MTKSSTQFLPRGYKVQSLVSIIAGSLLLRTAAGAMAENIQFYFNAIQQAVSDPNHPLRTIVGASHVYPISYTLGGAIIGSFFVAELLGGLVLGAWSDRSGRKLFIIFGPLLGAIAVLITSVTTVIWLLVFTRLLEGLSTASNTPATLGYLAEATSESHKMRTRISGLFEVATIGGIAIGFSLGGWLWHEFGTASRIAGIPLTSPAFAINAVVYLISLVILWPGVHQIEGEGQRVRLPSASLHGTFTYYWTILSSPRVAEFAPAWIAVNAVLGMWINLSARLLTDRNGFAGQILVGAFNSVQAGNLCAVYATTFIVGILVWSVFFPRMEKTVAMLIGTGGLLISCLLIFLINHQPILNALWMWPLAILLAASFMIQSGFTPFALAHLADITETHSSDRGVIMGLYSVFLGLGQFLGAGVGGIFADWRGMDGVTLATGLLGILAAILIIRLRHTAATQFLSDRAN